MRKRTGQPLENGQALSATWLQRDESCSALAKASLAHPARVQAAALVPRPTRRQKPFRQSARGPQPPNVHILHDRYAAWVFPWLRAGPLTTPRVLLPIKTLPASSRFPPTPP